MGGTGSCSPFRLGEDELECLHAASASHLPHARVAGCDGSLATILDDGSATTVLRPDRSLTVV